MQTNRLFVFVFVLFFWNVTNALAQNAQRNPTGNATGNQTIAQDVTRPFAEYRYVPQTGLYKDVTWEDGVDSAAGGIRNVGAFLNNLNFTTGWSQHDPSGFSFNLLGGVSQIRLPSGFFFYGSPYNGTSMGGTMLRAGPLMIDNIYLGYGLIYDDIQGSFPGREQLPPDDRWGQIVTLTFRTSFVLGNTIGFSIQPFLYWLPDIGKVGWGLPGPMGGFMGYQPNFMALFQMAYFKQVGNWAFTAYDVFNPRIFQYNIWDVMLSSQAAFGDLTPIERVGRYSLGYGAGDLSNYNPQSRFGVNPSNWNGMAGYYNIIGMRAQGTLGINTQTLLYFNRNDFWDAHFRNNRAGIAGGAYLQKGNPNFLVYSGYNFYSMQPFDTFLNWAVVGARKQMGPSLALYVQAGYFWYSGVGDNGSGALATLGLQQRLGQRTGHYLEVGRRVYTPVTGPQGIEDYIDYRINHMFGARSNISGFVGMSDRHIQGVGNSLKVKYAGMILNYMMTMRLSAFGSSGWAKTESGVNNAYVDDTWTHRLGLRHNLTETIQCQAYYQYQEVSTNSVALNYSEHFIYLGVTKRF